MMVLFENNPFFKKSYKKTSLDQTTRRRDDETRRRDETARRDGETTRRPYRGGPKSIPYFSNFWALFSGSGHYLSVEKSPRVNESTSRRVHESRQRVGEAEKTLNFRSDLEKNSNNFGRTSF